jgi:DNA-binding SARP family transcriptional activator
MSDLKLRCLGPLRIEVDGAPLEITRRKALALLVYLAVSNDSHSRDALATLFWPEANQRRARAALRSALWELNKSPLGDWLEVETESVTLNRSAGMWLDVTRFQQLLSSCQGHHHPAAEVCPACLDPLAEAVSLYRDDFLTGFTLPDAPDFDEWQFFQSESLRQQFASALERLARLHNARGDPAAAIPYARRWLSLDPLHEPAHRQLMLLYANSGQQAAALRQYQLCVDTLQAELGFAPTSETTALYEQIRLGKLSSRAEEQRSRGDFTAAPPPPRPPAQVIANRFAIDDLDSDLLGRGGMGNVC